MRGLNLSRLAARGRASEGSFFKDQQQQQAAKLRASLSPSDLASAKASAQASAAAAPSVDTLPEIAGHSAYRALLRHPAPRPAPPAQSTRPLVRRIADAGGAYVRAPSTPRAHADPGVLKALGSARLNLYSALPAQKANPLPGAERYADGAVLGMASFGVATSFVAAVGIAGGLYMYFSPTAVQTMRRRSVAFRAAIDSGLGETLRRFRDRMQSRGTLISDDAESRARSIAASVVKIPPPQPLPREDRTSREGGDSAASA